MIMIEVVIGNLIFKVFGESREWCILYLKHYLEERGMAITKERLDELAGSIEIGNGTMLLSTVI